MDFMINLGVMVIEVEAVRVILGTNPY